MAVALKELLVSLMGAREGVLPSLQTFPSLDLARIAQDLQVSEKASEAAKKNHPASDSASADTAELAIRMEIERRYRKATEEFESQADAYDGRIRRALVSTDQRAMIEAAGESALTDLKTQAIDHLNHLHILQDEVEGRAEELRSFRRKNRLDRLPTIPSRNETISRWLIIVILIAIESIINGLFFAEGSSAGIIGGVAQALGISVLNVGSALLYARYGIPFIRHRWIAARIYGICATLLYVLWATGLNLLVAHFRDQFILNEGIVSASSLATAIQSHPVTLADANSYLLAAIGLSLSIGSLIDGAKMGDEYWGYEAVGRRHNIAVTSYAEAKTRSLAELTNLRDEAIKQMGTAIELTRTFEFDLRLATEGRARLVKSYRAFLDHLEDCFRQLISMYREQNARIRTTEPPVHWSSPIPRPPFLTSPEFGPAPDPGSDARSHAIARMEHFIQAINHQFELEVQRYQTISSLTEPDEPHRVDT